MRKIPIFYGIGIFCFAYAIIWQYSDRAMLTGIFCLLLHIVDNQ